MARDAGPPEMERAAPTTETAAHQKSVTTDKPQNSGSARQCGSQTRPWRRRRQASYRLAPLNCGCADPLGCRCTQPALSDRALDGYRDAVAHLAERGLTAAPDVGALRAMWRNGGSDRRLAVQLAEAWDLAG